MDRRRKKKLDIFIAMTRGQSKLDIKRKEMRTGRKLERFEKREIIERNARRMKAKIFGLSLITLGLFAGVGGTRLLEEGKENRIKLTQNEATIDASKLEKENINIENLDDKKQVFINSLKVDENELTQNEAISETIENEIDSLYTSGQTLDYIKDIYAKQYNENNQSNINKDNVVLYKTREPQLYKDTAQNGVEIYRISKEREYPCNVQSEAGVIKAQILDENKKIIKEERITQDYITGEYIVIYDEEEPVTEIEDTTLKQLGGIVSNGIDLYTAQKYQEESKGQNHAVVTYKKRLKADIKEYKADRIKQIVTGKNEQEKELFDIE